MEHLKPHTWAVLGLSVYVISTQHDVRWLVLSAVCSIVTVIADIGTQSKD